MANLLSSAAADAGTLSPLEMTFIDDRISIVPAQRPQRSRHPAQHAAAPAVPKTRLEDQNWDMPSITLHGTWQNEQGSHSVHNHVTYSINYLLKQLAKNANVESQK